MKNEKRSNSLEELSTSIDTFSNESINNSNTIILFKSTLTSIKNNLNLLNYSNFFYNLLLLSTIVTLGALILPQFASDRFGVGVFTIVNFIVFILYGFSKKDFSIRFNSIDFIFICFLLIATISTFSSYFFKESLIGLFKYLIFFIGYFVFKNTISNSPQKTLLILFSSLFTFAVIASSIGIYQYIIGVEPLATWEDSNAEDTHTRVYSTLGNPNLLAGYLLLILPLGFTLPFEFKNPFSKLLFFIGSLIILTSIIFTGSRGAYIAVFAQILISTIVIAVSTLKRFKINPTISIGLTFIVSIVIIGIIIVLFPVVKERILTIFTLREHSSNSYRLNVWISCLNMLKDNILIGIGPGNSTFRLAYGLYMTSGYDALAAYNIFLEFALEIGFLGFFIALFIFLISFLKLHVIFWSKGVFLGLGIFISLLGVLLHGMFDTVFFRPQIFIPFWLLISGIDKLENNKE